MATPDRQMQGYAWTADLPPAPLNEDELRLLARLTGTTGKTVGDLTRERNLVYLASGAEHNVYIQHDSKSVVKLAYKGTGFTLAYRETADSDGKIVVRQGSVRDYVKRIARINREFDASMNVIGVYKDEETGKIFIAHTQKYFGGPENEPTADEIGGMMASLGFQRLDPRIIAESIATETYYNPDKNLIVGDCAPRNFRKVNGRLYPIDVVVQKPEGRFKELALANMLP